MLESIANPEPNTLALMRRPHCVVCQSGGAPLYQALEDAYFGAPGAWDVWQCVNHSCGLMWLDPAPHPDDLWKAYRSYHTHSGQSAGGVWYVRMARRCCKLLSQPVNLWNGLAAQHRRLRYMFLDQVRPGRLLEIGFGGGRFLHRMRQRGWQVEGVDFDAEATRRARERYGLDVQTGELAAMGYGADRFDAVVMSHSIEHLVDPRATLVECRRILRPGGLVSITTPNASSLAHRLQGRYWRGLEPPRHLQVFTPEALHALVVQCGLELVQSATLSCDSAGVHSVGELQAARGQGRPVHPLRALLRGFVRQHQEHGECRRGLCSGQDLLVLARKPATGLDRPLQGPSGRKRRQ